MEQNKFYSVNIRNFFCTDDGEIEEDGLREMLSDFSCARNPDVEHFLRHDAVDFAKKNQSVTYLVLSAQDGELLGYFTLAVKPLTIFDDGTLSRTVQRKLLRVSKLDERTGTYTLAAYLIAQLGKNDAVEEGARISGRELLALAMDEIYRLQYHAGGMVVFLESVAAAPVLSFYERETFRRFDVPEVGHEKKLVQFMKLL